MRRTKGALKVLLRVPRRLVTIARKPTRATNNAVEAELEDRIVSAYRKFGVMTPNWVRRIIHPERGPGVEVFVRIHGRLIRRGILHPVGRTQRSVLYRLGPLGVSR